MPRIRPLLASASAWTVGAVVAVAVGLLSLSLIQAGLTAEEVQSFAPDAATQTAAPAGSPSATATAAGTPGASASPTPAATSAAPPSSNERLLTSDGGNVVARCRDGLAYLVYWSPAPGYHAGDVSRGPAAVAKVTFEKERESEVKVWVTCADNIPQAVVHDDD